MQILQRFIFGDVCYLGSLDNRMGELVTIRVLTALSALSQPDAQGPIQDSQERYEKRPAPVTLEEYDSLK